MVRSGCWTCFIPGVVDGTIYKYHIESHAKGIVVNKADPFATRYEVPPRTASMIWDALRKDIADRIGVGAAVDRLVGHLRGQLKERGGLILLDGMDEVPEADRRRRCLVQAIGDFVGQIQDVWHGWPAPESSQRLFLMKVGRICPRHNCRMSCLLADPQAIHAGHDRLRQLAGLHRSAR